MAERGFHKLGNSASLLGCKSEHPQDSKGNLIVKEDVHEANNKDISRFKERFDLVIFRLHG